MTREELSTGATVGYAGVHLLSYRGTVTVIGATKHGGDCLVRWNGNNFDSEECSANLRRL